MTDREKTVEKGSEIFSNDSMEVAHCSVPIAFHAYECNPVGFLVSTMYLF